MDFKHNTINETFETCCFTNISRIVWDLCLMSQNAHVYAYLLFNLVHYLYAPCNGKESFAVICTCDKCRPIFVNKGVDVNKCYKHYAFKADAHVNTPRVVTWSQCPSVDQSLDLSSGTDRLWRPRRRVWTTTRRRSCSWWFGPPEATDSPSSMRTTSTTDPRPRVRCTSWPRRAPMSSATACPTGCTKVRHRSFRCEASA